MIYYIDSSYSAILHKGDFTAMSNKKTQNFVEGALILMIANILVKVIGAVFKIPLNYLLGDEGMGYFNAAYSIYSWFYLLSTAGLPVAVSILVADCRAKGKAKEIKTIFRVTLLMFILIGLAGMGIMMGGSKIFAFLPNPSTQPKN